MHLKTLRIPGTAARPGILLPLLLTALLGLPAPAWSQNKALDLAADKNTEMNPTLREGLQIIGRYAETVNRQLQGPSTSPAPTAAEVTLPPLPKPVPAASRRFEAANDPFEVSPRLREGRGGSRFTNLPGASILELQQSVQVRALLIFGDRAAAQLSIRDGAPLTVMDKELVDLGPLGTFQVEIRNNEVALFSPSAPGKKVVLR